MSDLRLHFDRFENWPKLKSCKQITSRRYTCSTTRIKCNTCIRVSPTAQYVCTSTFLYFSSLLFTLPDFLFLLLIFLLIFIKNTIYILSLQCLVKAKCRIHLFGVVQSALAVTTVSQLLHGLSTCCDRIYLWMCVL